MDTKRGKVLLALLVTGALLTALAACTSEPDGDSAGAQERDVTFVPGVLSTSNRANLSVCVDGAAGADLGDTDVGAVRDTLDSALEGVSPIFEGVSELRQEAAVTGGCPAPEAALTAAQLDDPSREAHGDLLVDPMVLRIIAPDTPSEHRVFVYFVPADVYGEAFGDKPYAMGPAEMYCERTPGNCAEVTTALYLAEGAGSDALADGLLDAVGLLPFEGDTPTDPREAEEQRERALTPVP